MKFSLALLLGFVGAAASATAAPILYTINFTTTLGLAPTGGQFSYDAPTATFTNFTVTWNTIVYDLTSMANSGGGSVTGLCVSAPPGAQAFANLTDPSCGTVPGQPGLWTASSSIQSFHSTFNLSPQVCCPSDYWFLSEPGLAGPPPATFSEGTFQVTAVPEPSTIAMLLGGAALVALRRKHSMLSNLPGKPTASEPAKL